jgi:hypothetical protein
VLACLAPDQGELPSHARPSFRCALGRPYRGRGAVEREFGA